MDLQIPMFVEDYPEAIRAAVQALGGFKRVGTELKPDLAADAAGRWLADCLNPEKRDILPLSALAYIRRRAREKGCHILAAFEAQESGYAPPVPLNPEDERAKIEREFVMHLKGAREMVDRMERLQRDHTVLRSVG
jgi:hypothetical protein